ncbi:MAG: tetrahydrofolate dehydrogenase/cyclohydrolase catalytic domain-containing protein [Candidatus Latescibacterota bacterium]|nr:tetrahydrofolate dehydrogenase/cyclohydrolase catalytic domain-containing protein [Candidatus Latescibacterota bacterium]
MAAQLLEGKPVAESVLEDVKERTVALNAKGVVPGLGTILVGGDSVSAGYVARKHETCETVGIKSFHIDVRSDQTQASLIDAVDSFNENPEVDAYLIQHPLPDGFDFNAALSRMAAAKDADGLHPENLGKLVLQEPGPIPCTPAGIQAMFVHYGINISGKEVVVIGRGPTLGRPLALLLTLKQAGANAAVTVVHTGVPDISFYTKRADIVVAAAGVPNFVKPEMIKAGSIVVSGGITWKGKRLQADVDESVGEVAGWVTPRLGGVGPTTVAMLLRNTVRAAEGREN